MKRSVKTLSIFLSAIMLLSSAAFAAEGSSVPETPGVYAVSPQFPDAYIIVASYTPDDSNNAIKEGEKNTIAVAATVFVEETYDYVDGEEVVTSSRLLSKKEVDAIGEENFGTKDSTADALNSVTGDSIARLSTNVSNSYYKLTISEAGSYTVSGTSVTAYMSGSANWSGFNFLYSGNQNPAVGNDYIGYAWSGGYSASQEYAEAFWSDLNTAAVITATTGAPNAARVWMFNEYMVIGSSKYYANTGISTALKKNTLTGNGNTAEVMLKYIHTYQSTTGSISISASSSGVGGGFSLSSCPNQWELACYITGIPY